MLLDPEGKKIPGFPLKGTGPFIISDLFNDNKNAIITTAGKELIVYKF